MKPHSLYSIQPRRNLIEASITSAVQRLVNAPASGQLPLVNQSQFQHYRPSFMPLSAVQIPIQQATITRFENDWMTLYKSIPAESREAYSKGFTIDQKKLSQLTGFANQIQNKLAEHTDPATGISQLSSEKLPLFQAFLSGDVSSIEKLNAMSGGRRRKRKTARRKRTLRKRKV
jgi:hypothetical protein